MIKTQILFSFLLTLTGVVALAQSNLFPGSGNVGVGTNDPQLKLDVQGGGISVSGVNPISSINGFRNALQFKNASHAAIVYNPGESSELMFGFHNSSRFFWGSKANGYRMILNDAGHLHVYNSLQIGNLNVSGYALSVNGKAIAKEVKVSLAEWADYVFRPGYNLLSLKEVDVHIKEHGHLPGIPVAEDVLANGIDLGEMNRKLLEKIEELTLHAIEQDKRVDQLEAALEQVLRKGRKSN